MSRMIEQSGIDTRYFVLFLRGETYLGIKRVYALGIERKRDRGLCIIAKYFVMRAYSAF